MASQICRRCALAPAGVMAFLLLTGCASSGPYRYGVNYPAALPEGASADEPNIEIARGKPSRVVDGAGWIFGVPERIVLWNWRAGNHHVSEETEQAVCGYLYKNDLTDVKLRLNQYDPLGEFRRLRENKRMGAAARYTLGTLSVVGYTVVPGRVFGGDYYNPYTNTVNIYSDVPAIGIREAAYAKDVHNREYPGTYAAVNELPVVGMWHETINTKEAIAYYGAEGSNQEQREAYHVLAPRYGAHAGGVVSGLSRPAEGAFVLGGGVFSVAGALVGHAVGRVEAPPPEQSTNLQSTEEESSEASNQQASHEAADFVPVDTVAFFR